MLKALSTTAEAEQVQRIFRSLDAGLVRDLLPAGDTISEPMVKIDAYEEVWKRQSAERVSRTPRQLTSGSTKANSSKANTNRGKAKKASNQVYSQNRIDSGPGQARYPAAETPPGAFKTTSDLQLP